MSPLAIILSTFVSEDLACIAVGVLIQQAKLNPWTGVISCTAGIFLGDLALWLLGRLAGLHLLEWRWIRQRLPRTRTDQLARWFERRGWQLVFLARFLPGTRFPVYVGAGLLGQRAAGFALAALLAALLWTPALVLLVSWAGQPVIDAISRYVEHDWVVFALAIVPLFLALRTVELLTTEAGRGRLMAGFARIWRWEFWPMWVFYLPLVPWIAWLALRHRGLMTPTAANPAIPHGGFVGESKYEILCALPRPAVVPTELLAPAPVDQRVAELERRRSAHRWSYPLILKPDASQRGEGVKLIHNTEQAARYFETHTGPTLAQVYHPGPHEAGIFYYRYPDQAHGRIFSITDKAPPEIPGDGVATLAQLIWRHPRYRMQARVFLARLGEQAERVPAAGERVRLAVAGNHCQGTLFRDGGHLLTPALEGAVDEIARAYPGFYFGRFDVRYRDADELRAGHGFAIIELNGATSESTNIYDPSWSIFHAYRVLAQQWRILFEIGAGNRRNGARVSSFGEVWRASRAFYRDRRVSRISD